MRAQSTVLICEDHPPTAAALSATARRYNLAPKVFGSAAEAYRYLEEEKNQNHPLWAVMDLDMRYAKEQTPTSWDTLRYLAKYYPDVAVIVYSGALDQASSRIAVIKSHPKAWLHDKSDGPNELFQRLNAMMTKTVGNLVLSQGYCLHQPSNKVFDHRVAIRLMISYPAPCHVHSPAEVRAIQRFRHWLEENDPTISIVSHGGQTYSLYEKP